MKQLLIIFSLLAGINGTAQPYVFTKTPGGITLSDSGRPVYHYQTKTTSLDGRFPRAHYIHPLYGFDGEVLTEDFPADHPHQRGIFWTWHQIFLDKYRVGDGWDCRNITWEVDTPIMDVTPHGALLIATCYWSSDSLYGIKSTPKRFLKEDCALLYFNKGPDTCVLGFTFTFTAFRGTVRLGASEDEKQYGGFSARLALPDDVKFFSDTTELIPEINGNMAGKEVKMTGSFGKYKNLSFIFESGTAGKGDRQKWILRKEKSMQNIAWPGNNKYITIEPGHPLMMIYYQITITRNRNK